MDKRASIIYQNSEISYLRFGRGKTLLFAFHGYSNAAELFLPLRSVLEEKYTVISVDLPWHGRTRIGDKHFGKKDFIRVLREIADRYPACTSVELMGYSYGGRICLNIFPEMKARRLWLLAADGLDRARPFHYFPVFLRRAVSRFIDKPARFLRMLNYLHKRKIIPGGSHAFMSFHLQNAASRRRLTGTWLFLPDFRANRKKILRDLRRSQTKITMIFGKYDKIILPVGGQRLADTYERADIHFINSGHRIFTAELSALLSRLLK